MTYIYNVMSVIECNVKHQYFMAPVKDPHAHILIEAHGTFVLKITCHRTIRYWRCDIKISL